MDGAALQVHRAAASAIDARASAHEFGEHAADVEPLGVSVSVPACVDVIPSVVSGCQYARTALGPCPMDRPTWLSTGREITGLIVGGRRIGDVL